MIMWNRSMCWIAVEVGIIFFIIKAVFMGGVAGYFGCRCWNLSVITVCNVNSVFLCCAVIFLFKCLKNCILAAL